MAGATKNMCPSMCFPRWRAAFPALAWRHQGQGVRRCSNTGTATGTHQGLSWTAEAGMLLALAGAEIWLTVQILGRVIAEFSLSSWPLAY